MFKWIFRILGIIVLLSVLLVLGTCAWQNCRGPKTTPSVALPSIEKAAYSINISVTGQSFYSPKVDVVKNPAGDVVIMHGYWEVTKGKYKFHSNTLSLNEAIFGNIEVRKR